MTSAPLPPKPPSRPEGVSFLRHLKLFRADILSSQPARLYHALMAEFRTPFFRSYLCNDPALVDLVLRERPQDFPKSERVRAGLAPLLGRSVFVTNGAEWERQRRIIDPAFEGGRLKETFPAMCAAGLAARDRLIAAAGTTVEIEAETARLAADVIFRTLFSVPIEDRVAAEVFERFRDFQKAQPLVNLAAFLPVARFLPRLHSRRTLRAARDIRDLIRRMTENRAAAIGNGNAPDDLATKIMTTPDPMTGRQFSSEEMVDQVAIFFLAGHETSASALAWALYLLATHPDAQDRAAAEGASLGPVPEFGDLGKLAFTRDVFREALRLYPPVPMMVRTARCPVTLRRRPAPKGAQIVISPWHLHRHDRFWRDPDAFDPARWAEKPRAPFVPFSAGPRVCPGAGFAMIEGPLLLAILLRDIVFRPGDSPPPVPVAHLTVRSQQGIPLKLSLRTGAYAA